METFSQLQERIIPIQNPLNEEYEEVLTAEAYLQERMRNEQLNPIVDQCAIEYCDKAGLFLGCDRNTRPQQMEAARLYRNLTPLKKRVDFLLRVFADYEVKNDVPLRVRNQGWAKLAVDVSYLVDRTFPLPPGFSPETGEAFTRLKGVLGVYNEWEVTGYKIMELFIEYLKLREGYKEDEEEGVPPSPSPPPTPLPPAEENEPGPSATQLDQSVRTHRLGDDAIRFTIPSVLLTDPILKEVVDRYHEAGVECVQAAGDMDRVRMGQAVDRLNLVKIVMDRALLRPPLPVGCSPTDPASRRAFFDVEMALLRKDRPLARVDAASEERRLAEGGKETGKHLREAFWLLALAEMNPPEGVEPWCPPQPKLSIHLLPGQTRLQGAEPGLRPYKPITDAIGNCLRMFEEFYPDASVQDAAAPFLGFAHRLKKAASTAQQTPGDVDDKKRKFKELTDGIVEEFTGKRSRQD
jgi:hypothetical protein